MIRKSVLLPLGPDRAFALFTQRIGEWWPPERRHTSDLNRRAGNLDPGAIELAQHPPRQRVFGFANAVFRHDETNGEIDPVVRDAPEHAGLVRLERDAISSLQSVAGAVAGLP